MQETKNTSILSPLTTIPPPILNYQHPYSGTDTQPTIPKHMRLTPPRARGAFGCLVGIVGEDLSVESVSVRCDAER